MTSVERKPLLGKNKTEEKQPISKYSGEHNFDGIIIETEEPKIQRHITKWQCVGIIIGNVIGAGIFTSPRGVLEKINSIGATLIVWLFSGLYALCQSLCYAELGVVIPKAGGDYAYIYGILGPMPGFMCAWIQMTIVGCSSNGVLARTAGLYVATPLGLECLTNVITLLGIFVIVLFALINIIDVRLSTEIQNICSFAKIFALGIIIITGVVAISKGHTENFKNSFQQTSTEPGLIAMAILNGYYSYKGWELVNTLPEEMINPEKDLPQAVWISMILCTFIYVLTNAAYFSVITSQQMLTSDAVALTFMHQTLGTIGEIVMSIFVVVSCMGTINGSFLSDSRYVFAAGRNKQLPCITSMIHRNYCTPVIGIIIICITSMCYSLFPEISTLQVYTAIATQFKICLSLIALFYLRWTKPDLPRPVRVNTFLACITFTVLVTLLGLALYEDPFVVGAGFGLFFLGIPAFAIINNGGKVSVIRKTVDKFTLCMQKILLVVPEAKDNLSGEAKIK